MLKKYIRYVIYFLLIFTLLACGKEGAKREEHLEVTFIDVKKGDGIYIKTPNQKNILIDCGIGEMEECSFDAGKIRILPLLRKEKVDKLDMVIISHLHYDHFGGIFSLLGKVRIESLLFNFPDREIFRYDELISLVNRNNTEIRSLHRGETIDFQKLKLHVLNPPKGRRFYKENDNSIVILLKYRKIKFLFTGDVEDKAIEEIMKVYPDKIQADIIKVPHHGGRGKNTLKFLSLINPKIAIITEGPGNSKESNKDLLSFCKKKKISVYRTNYYGNIKIITDGLRVKVRTKRWVLW